MVTIIIEDEKPSARRLQRMLEKLKVEVIKTLHSVEESINWFREQQHPDIIFLDIQLNDGLSFEIFEAVKIQSAVIFTTAFDEYALQAFKLNSIDYLLKPIDEDELATAVIKYRNMTGNNSTTGNTAVQLNIEDIKRLLVNPLERSYKKRFTVKVGSHLKMIPIEDIECFYSENKSTYIFTSQNRNYPVEYTIELLEDELPPDNFFRVNRKYIINLNAITDIITFSNSRLKIKMQTYKEDEIIVARERVKAFKEWLD